MPADDDDNDFDDLNTSNNSANFHDEIPISDNFFQLKSGQSLFKIFVFKCSKACPLRMHLIL